MKRLVLARIDAYRTRKYGEHPPGDSYSARIRAECERNLIRGLSLLLLGYVVTYVVPLFAKDRHGYGPMRRQYGWRKGGI